MYADQQAGKDAEEFHAGGKRMSNELNLSPNLSVWDMHFRGQS